MQIDKVRHALNDDELMNSLLSDLKYQTPIRQEWTVSPGEVTLVAAWGKRKHKSRSRFALQ